MGQQRNSGLLNGRFGARFFRVLLAACLIGTVGLAAGSWYVRRPWHRYHQAEVAIARNDVIAVQQQWEALRLHAEYQPHARLLSGYLLTKSGKFAPALDELQQAFDHPDTRVQARVLAGECLYRDRQYNQAVQLLDEALQIDPNQVDALRWLAGLYYDLGAMANARECLKRVAELAPEDGRPHYAMAQMDLLFSQFDDAAHGFSEALRRDCGSGIKRDEVLLGQALSLIQLREYAEALAALEAAELSAGSLALKAECHYGLGDKTQATKLLEEALKLRPGHLSASSLRGKIYLEKDDARQAVRVLKLAAQKHPEDYEIRHILAVAYRQLGDKAKADRELERAKALQSGRKTYQQLLNEARTKPDDPHLRYKLGVAALELGQRELAKKWFKAALGMNPNHQQARKALKDLEESD